MWSTKEKTVQLISWQRRACDSQVTLYSESELVAASFWTPGVGAAVNYHTMKRTMCVLVKDINYISQALTALSTEITQVRETALENWATIDYLVFRHNQGCEELKGMCWFNLSNNSWLIEKKETTKETSHKCYRDRKTRFLLAGFMATLLKLRMVKTISCAYHDVMWYSWL